MFIVTLPTTVKIGDTDDVEINGEPEKVTWRDADTLVIEPGDARDILSMDVSADGKLRQFFCATAGGDGVVIRPDPDGNVITIGSLAMPMAWEQALYDELRSLEIWVEAWRERHAEERKQPPYERASILQDIDAILTRLQYRCAKMRDRLDRLERIRAKG